MTSNQTRVDAWSDVSNNLQTKTTQEIVDGSICTAHVLVALQTLFALHRHKSQPFRVKHATFVILLLILGTFNVVGRIMAARTLILEDLYFYLGKDSDPKPYHNPFFILSSCISSVLITALTEGYMLYRCSVVWNHRITVLIIPGFLYIGSLVMSSIYLYASFGMSYWSSLAEGSALAQWSISLSLNTGITALIVARLYYTRHKVRSAFGRSHGKSYSIIIAMLVESSLLYTLATGIGVPLLPAAQSGLGRVENAMYNMNIMTPLLAQTECIAAEFIVWRFAVGYAWSRNTNQVVTRYDGSVGREESIHSISSSEQQPEALRIRIDTDMSRTSISSHTYARDFSDLERGVDGRREMKSLVK